MCCSSNNKFDEFRTTARCVDRGPGLGRKPTPPPPEKADWGPCRQAHDAELTNASPGQSQAEPGDATWGPLKAAGLGAAHERRHRPGWVPVSAESPVPGSHLFLGVQGAQPLAFAGVQGLARDWDQYALRATNYAFSPPGQEMRDRLAGHRHSLIRLEGIQDELDLLRGSVGR
jgi:hypothetical protein